MLLSDDYEIILNGSNIIRSIVISFDLYSKKCTIDIKNLPNGYNSQQSGFNIRFIDKNNQIKYNNVQYGDRPISANKCEIALSGDDILYATSYVPTVAIYNKITNTEYDTNIITAIIRITPDIISLTRSPINEASIGDRFISNCDFIAIPKPELPSYEKNYSEYIKIVILIFILIFSIYFTNIYQNK
ncbi:hypothetical protein CHREV_019 [Choristoneura rosaceana entomopoxvirus 'L']|uniref:Uncharacterized protein n=1 Tax=Choristoneura rosaceana entomopoxvirus 'L' TaxID=1293539 RepID=A0ABM9QK51_9POXV|nr:hypothetical protein CHREV_019 [Choristoneura rosaceana entomopoxvirus 'L']CCU55921.1 hypothetical protein CHREV_019 [Choristoneura rosaceana entomopoxvirus 'L']